MARQSVTFSDPQFDWLQEEAKALGLTTSEVVRRVVDDARRGLKYDTTTRKMLIKTTRETMLPRVYKRIAK